MMLFARVCSDHPVHSHGHWSAPRDESRISPRTPAIASRGQYFPLPGPKRGAMTSPSSGCNCQLPGDDWLCKRRLTQIGRR
jgi:hypothetical protein